MEYKPKVILGSIIGTFVLMLLILLANSGGNSFVRAEEYNETNNTMEYSNNDMDVEFKNKHNNSLGKAKLKSHYTVNEIRTIGFGKEEVVIYYDFENWQYTKGGLGEPIFRNMKTDNLIEKDYTWVEWEEVRIDVDDYENPCEPEEELDRVSICNAEIVGDHDEYRYMWVEKEKNSIPAGDSRIGLKTYVRQYDHIDVQLEIVGKHVKKHAQWTGELDDAIAYWSFDEESGSVVNDLVASSDWTLQNMEDPGDWTDGILEGGLRFGGTDEYGSGGDINLDYDAVTISIFVNVDTQGNYNYFYGNDDNGNVDGELGSHMNADGSIYMLSNDGATETFLDSNFDGTTGVWYHIVNIWNETGMFIFIDGVYGNGNTFVNRPNIANWYLGGSIFYANNLHIGIEDEMGIWSRSLSQEEITFLNNSVREGCGYLDDCEVIDFFSINGTAMYSNLTTGVNGAKIFVLNETFDGKNYTTTTNSTGHWSIFNVDNGTYTIVAVHENASINGVVKSHIVV